MEDRTEHTTMPLTEIQKKVLAVLLANRSERGHFAGGLVLNASEESARFSNDFDIFHDETHDLDINSRRDVESMETAGFAFVDACGEPGWIGDNPDLNIHYGSLHGCWPTVSAVED